MLTRADERGFTLAELAVAMSLLMLVIGALLAALESGTSAERRASTRIDDEQSVQLVLAQFARDVRNAAPQPGSPPVPLLSAPTGNEIDLGYGGGTIEWTYSAATGVLQRSLNADGVLTRTVSLDGLANTGTVFQVLAPDGTNLIGGTVPADVTTCAASVVASVTASGHAPSKPFAESVNAVLDAPAIDRRGCP